MSIIFDGCVFIIIHGTPGETKWGHWTIRYESENINFTLALTKRAFLCFHRVSGQLAVSLVRASVATSGAGRRCIARASTRLACAHPRLHNRPPTPRAVPRAPHTPPPAHERNRICPQSSTRALHASARADVLVRHTWRLRDMRAPGLPVANCVCILQPSVQDRYVTT